MAHAKVGRLCLSEHCSDGDGLLAEYGIRGMEDVVSKRRDGAYRSGEQAHWIKVKCPAWREANRERHKLFQRE